MLFVDANDLIHRPYGTDEHAYISRRVLLCHDLRVVACVLDCFPGHLQKKPLLRIQHFCLSGRNVEEQRVELIHVVNEAAAVPLDASMLQTPVITVCRNLLDTISASSQVVPQFSQILRLGIAAGHSYDRDVLRSAQSCIHGNLSRLGFCGNVFRHNSLA